MKIIEPVLLRPLCREWEEVKAKIEAEQAKAKAAEADAARTHHRNAAREFYLQFRERLGGFRVLDPACGSGNFLYLSLWHLKDFDLQVMNEPSPSPCRRTTSASRHRRCWGSRSTSTRLNSRG